MVIHAKQRIGIFFYTQGYARVTYILRETNNDLTYRFLVLNFSRCQGGICIVKVSEGTRSSGRSTSAQNRPFSVMPKTGCITVKLPLCSHSAFYHPVFLVFVKLPPYATV